MYNFLSNSNLTIGNGSIDKIVNFINDDNFKYPLFLIDSGFENTEYWKNKFLKLTQNKNFTINCITIHNRNEPNYDDLRQYIKLSRQFNPDVIFGFGGGSCMDLSKAIGALLKNDKDPTFYKGFDKVENKGVPVILIPTVAGTGSEASFNASFVDEDTKIKMGINGKNMFAYKAILDAEATLSCPKKPAIGAAMDSLVHAIEAYICKFSNTFSDMLAEKAIELIIPSILDLNSKKPNLEKRLNLLKGAYLAGLAQMNGGGGLSSATSYPFSVYYKIPHGIAGAIFLLEYCKFNIEYGVGKYTKLFNGIPEYNVKNAYEFIKVIEDIYKQLKIPKKLSNFGIYKKEKENIIKIMQTQQIGFDQNPIEFNVNKHFPDFIDKFLE